MGRCEERRGLISVPAGSVDSFDQGIIRTNDNATVNTRVKPLRLDLRASVNSRDDCSLQRVDNTRVKLDGYTFTVNDKTSWILRIEIRRKNDSFRGTLHYVDVDRPAEFQSLSAVFIFIAKE